MSRLCRLCQCADIYLNRKRVFVQGTNSICDALRDLVSVGQFKKREKNPRRSVTFSKVALLWNCTNGTESRKASHLLHPRNDNSMKNHLYVCSFVSFLFFFFFLHKVRMPSKIFLSFAGFFALKTQDGPTMRILKFNKKLTCGMFLFYMKLQQNVIFWDFLGQK